MPGHRFVASYFPCERFQARRKRLFLQRHCSLFHTETCNYYLCTKPVFAISSSGRKGTKAETIHIKYRKTLFLSFAVELPSYLLNWCSTAQPFVTGFHHSSKQKKILHLRQAESDEILLGLDKRHMEFSSAASTKLFDAIPSRTNRDVSGEQGEEWGDTQGMKVKVKICSTQNLPKV